GLDYPEAAAFLDTLSVVIRGGEAVRKSAALQAAVLTAVNTAKRCFRRVSVELPESIALLIPWPADSLNEAVDYLLSNTPAAEGSLSLISVGTETSEGWNIVASGWRALVTFGGTKTQIFNGPDFALGGVLAGAIGVHHAFVDATGIDQTLRWKRDGVSLWRPDLLWDTAPDGPELSALPDKIWFLGLGHLGQAYAWTMALLPYGAPWNCEIMIQDIDQVSVANFGTGLLTNASDVTQRKTRMVERWLSDRNFEVLLCDRKFNENTVRSSEEPAVALCGFHDANSRRILDRAGFELIVEAGLGAEIADFDQLSTHKFPNSHFTPAENWSENAKIGLRKERLAQLGGEGICGAIELAGKAVSTSFVGAAAAAFSWAEILRNYHKGASFSRQHIDLRSLSDTSA
ncbi:MAG: hypothetical protein ACREDP_23835, partial [Bradyrhizobium sp.]